MHVVAISRSISDPFRSQMDSKFDQEGPDFQLQKRDECQEFRLEERCKLRGLNCLVGVMNLDNNETRLKALSKPSGSCVAPEMSMVTALHAR